MFVLIFQVLLVGSFTADDQKDEHEAEGSFRAVYVNPPESV